jgi:predicted ATPase
MKQYPLVGRNEALLNLRSVLAQGWNHHGSIIFIEGAAGMGKTMLLRMLQEQSTQFPEFAKITFTYGYCYESTGSQSAYQPFIEILETLTKTEASQKNVAKLMLTLVKETAPDWLQMIPTLGPALGAGVKSASIVKQWFLDTSDENQAPQSIAMAFQYINILVKIASQRNLLVLIIEDAHWIDDASCQLLLRLSYRISEQPMVVLVTYRPDDLQTQHPLQRIQREMLIKGNAQVIRLLGLNEEQIQTYIHRRFESSLNPKLAVWMEHLCKGNPLFVTQYLSLLEQDRIIQRGSTGYLLNGDIRYLSGEWLVSGKLADMPIPESIEALLEQRIDHLIDEDRELLQLASVQGDYFMSSLLADLIAKRELDILSQLRRVIERHHIISLSTGDGSQLNRLIPKRSEPACSE